jgi:hypothetical protein
MATTTEHTPDDAKFAQEIARLAEAIRDLAHRPERLVIDEDPKQRRRIQRVDFGYRALGTLMGRAGSDFDVPVFGASWHRRGRVIVLPGLPKEVEFVQLQNGAKDETLKVRRGRDDHDSPYEKDATDSRGGELPPWISPETFTPRDAISSVLGLRHRHGPVIALGPRIAPIASYA